MIKELPPLETDVSLESYLIRILNHIEAAINDVDNVITTRSVPDKPRTGKIYYLSEDLDNRITQGYWIWYQDSTLISNGYWEKFVVGSELNDLEARVSALEAP
jgi:hypothetical protein